MASLPDYLDQEVFVSAKSKSFEAAQDDKEGFNSFFENYTAGLAVEKAAIENV